jgi:hypothetical protein
MSPSSHSFLFIPSFRFFPSVSSICQGFGRRVSLTLEHPEGFGDFDAETSTDCMRYLSSLSIHNDCSNSLRAFSLSFFKLRLGSSQRSSHCVAATTDLTVRERSRLSVIKEEPISPTQPMPNITCVCHRHRRAKHAHAHAHAYTPF